MMAQQHQSQPRCKLLDLPAELRNRIYEFALCSRKIRLIAPHTLIQPGLLRTCKKIKAEASSIYYKGNLFYIEVNHFKIHILKAFLHGQAARFRPLTWCACVDRGNLHTNKWSNLVAWVKAAYDGRVPALTCGKAGGGSNVERAIARTFEIAARLHKARVAWSTVEEVLLIHRESTQEVVGWV